MVRYDSLTRRRVASLLATGAIGVIAGCADNGDDDTDDETDAETDDDADDDTDLEFGSDDPDFEILLEDTNGEAVSSEDVTLEILDHETDIEYTIDQEIEDGVAEPDFTEATTYTVAVVSDEYEDTADEITLEEGDDEELSFELESAS
ncbi:hypothetical protein [Natronolimnobius baerhuensis]|uniref:PEGA domain-containing protein n=1 Tax=Natronolimnobius baerhuensis TaxID=253108 RepID=A0A202EC82_9EURY|nr:hypothetical protein [Natronolimnobius baerhuensis]OVE85832.1 PEGA domain-containing protein [Natronolimnobius baerhuensis]